MHASGVHATVAGVLLGLAVPARDLCTRFEHRFEHRFQPFSAGVACGGLSGLRSSLVDPVALGIVAGLVLGEPLATTATAWLGWGDVAAAATLAGIGFTVALLVGELGFAADVSREEHVEVGGLTASVPAAVAGAVALRLRARAHRGL